MAKILVVDDEKNIIELVKFNLMKEGWDIDVAFDGRTAIDLAFKNKPDIIILDIMLPEIDGLAVCRTLRANNETKDIPIIMLSAKSEEFDKVLGIELGADDYMAKPFSPRELIARIKARLRKKKVEIRDNFIQGKEIKVGDIIMCPERFEVFIRGEKRDLTLKEFELLQLLLTNRGKVFTREYLLERVWNYNSFCDTRTVDVHVRYLRKKIEKNPAAPKHIETIRGVGYRFT
ncbi:MAG: winged helix-turn-helix domain-containing protein [Eubacteriales bacterium]